MDKYKRYIAIFVVITMLLTFSPERSLASTENKEKKTEMRSFENLLLRQRVIPIIILFGLLPRTFYYVLKDENFKLSLSTFLFFLLISAIYIYYRFRLVLKREPTKRRLIYTVLDTTIIIIGIFIECYLQYLYDKDRYVFTCYTSIPFLVNNYIILHFKS